MLKPFKRDPIIDEHLLEEATDATPPHGMDKAAAEDYEEGDWTGAFVCGTSGIVTIKNEQKTGTYVKIGRQVTVAGMFGVDSVGTGEDVPQGDLRISGMPFTSGDDVKYRSGVAVYATDLESGAITQIMGTVADNASTILLRRFEAGAVVTDLSELVKANTVFQVMATYFI